MSSNLTQIYIHKFINILRHSTINSKSDESDPNDLVGIIKRRGPTHTIFKILYDLNQSNEKPANLSKHSNTRQKPYFIKCSK